MSLVSTNRQALEAAPNRLSDSVTLPAGPIVKRLSPTILP